MRFRRLAPAVLGLLLLAGCREPEVQAYRVPREKLPEPPVSSGARNPHATGGDRSAAGATGLIWKAPTTWEEKPASGFRRGSFGISGGESGTADLSIIAFPGNAGGLSENLNRWRGQIGLPTASEAEVSGGIVHLDGRGGLHFDVVDYLGSVEGAPTRILGAVTEFGGESWFFKLMGPDAIVASQRQSFIEFLHSVTPKAP
jgi:hypothetical protein